MDNRPNALGNRPYSGTVDLSQEPAFSVGHLRIVPAERRLESTGWSRRLEPRLVQVLIVLARAAPAVVGRAELNARVWEGRVVGEDAINRAVQLLRRTAEEAPPPLPFTIETIPRVGYRLTATSAGLGSDVAATSHAPAVLGESQRAWGWMERAAAVACVIAVLAAIAWMVWRGDAGEHSSWRIARVEAPVNLPADVADVAPSADGRWLAWRATDQRGRERIFVRATGDVGPGVAVSSPDLRARRPAWSPDGTRLAFIAFDPGHPCRLYVQPRGGAASRVGGCEIVRDPRLGWSGDGASLLLGDAPGENAVLRITAVRVRDGARTVLSTPPGDSMGDTQPVASGRQVVFQRQYGWADEGWIALNTATGRERLLWRQQGLAGSVAAWLPDGSIAVAWTRAGSSALDVVDPTGRIRTQSIAPGPVTAVRVSGADLLIETDLGESELVRAGMGTSRSVAKVRGRVAGPVLLPDGTLRVPVTTAGVARIWEKPVGDGLRPWGTLVAARIAGLALSPDGHHTAALVTTGAGRGITVLNRAGRQVFRWHPVARSLNPAAWTANGRRLIVPVLDGAGWRLWVLDPYGTPPRDLGLPGFAVLLRSGKHLYAVRAGETTGLRELWRIDDTGAQRLPVDLTLADIVNWIVFDDAIWLPERTGGDRPFLLLRDLATGRVLRRVPAPGLAGPGTGMAADKDGPVYVRTINDQPFYTFLHLTR